MILHFGKGIAAEANIAIWRERGTPMRISKVWTTVIAFAAIGSMSMAVARAADELRGCRAKDRASLCSGHVLLLVQIRSADLTKQTR